MNRVALQPRLSGSRWILLLAFLPLAACLDAGRFPIDTGQSNEVLAPAHDAGGSDETSDMAPRPPDTADIRTDETSAPDTAPYTEILQDLSFPETQAEVCQPDCAGKECGDNGCKGICGICPDFGVCELGDCLDGECVVLLLDDCCTTDADCVDCADFVTALPCPMDLSSFPGQCGQDSCMVNSCTQDTCKNHQCFHGVKPDCCFGDHHCVDDKPCTKDICKNGVCQNKMVANCCVDSGACNDADICTIDICDIPERDNAGVCTYQPKEDCCYEVTQCLQKTCANAYCVNGNCIYVDQPDCCIHDEQCDDDDYCTLDKCLNTKCTNTTVTPCP